MDDIWSRISIQGRLAILLGVLVIAPVGVVLLLEPTTRQEFVTYLALYLALAITAWFPLARVISRWVVVKELEQINAFCRALREGSPARLFNLPNESEQEHELLQLKRSLNHLMRSISGRESCLRDHLSETVRERSQLWELSIRDPLTKLYNRRFFENKILEVVEEARHHGSPCCLMLLDVDKFKQINDSHGHPEGDRLLAGLGTAILATTRQDRDFPFRYGGDEFGIIFCRADLKVAQEVAARIRQRYRAAWVGETSLSIGVAPLFDAGRSLMEEAASWIKAADGAVYRAKEAGGDRLVLADHEGWERWQEG